MKIITNKHFIYFTFFIMISIVASCKNSKKADASDDAYTPKGNIADLAYNPIKKDGTIDSTYLPIIKWDAVVYDFGTIHKGEIVEKNYTFKNIGTAPLIILNATTTCGCTVPQWPKTRILPDSIGAVLVRFNSTNKEGPQNKEVTIFANTIPNQIKLNIKGVVEKNK